MDSWVTQFHGLEDWTGRGGSIDRRTGEETGVTTATSLGEGAEAGVLGLLLIAPGRRGGLGGDDGGPAARMRCGGATAILADSPLVSITAPPCKSSLKTSLLLLWTATWMGSFSLKSGILSKTDGLPFDTRRSCSSKIRAAL